MLKFLETVKVKALVNMIPGWAMLGLFTLGGGIWGYIQSNTTGLLQDVGAGNWKAVETIGLHALLVGGTALWAYLKTDPWTQSTQKSGPSSTASIASKVAGVLGLTFLLGAATSCSPAQTAEMKSIEGVVLADIEANVGDPQIVADVTKIVVTNLAPNSPQVVAFATALAYDAVTFLIDSGIIPTQYLAAAKAHQSTLKTAAGK